MLQESIESHGSKHTAIQSIAPKIGCAAPTLDKWIKQAEIDDGKRAGESSDSKERIKQLE